MYNLPYHQFFQKKMFFKFNKRKNKKKMFFNLIKEKIKTFGEQKLFSGNNCYNFVEITVSYFFFYEILQI